ncbi:unannotated protein [freshwater metagenome]|uniref:Unannotated protein n=1 Tax=freshwater metagenome TaxID=449393 RepID=A0A6J7USZ5_9ZZZZ
MQGEPRSEARTTRPRRCLVGPVHEDVLPRDEHLVEHEDRVVLVQPARQWVVKWAAGNSRLELEGVAADQFDPGCVHRRCAHDSVRLVPHRQSVVGDEVVVRECRAGCDHLRTRHDEAVVGLFLDVHANPRRLVGGQVAVHGRVDDCVVPVWNGLLRLFVPVQRVGLVRGVELAVGAEGAEERRLVVGRPTHPSMDEALPAGDGVTAADEVLHRPGNLEEPMRTAAAPGVGLGGEDVPGGWVVQCVVHRRDGPHAVAERRVRGDVLDPLTLEVHRAAVAQALDVLGARVRTTCGGRGRLTLGCCHVDPPVASAQHGGGPCACLPTQSA